MIDMFPTILPKSDQLGAVDLMQGKTLDIKITAVDINPKAEQKTTINYEGDNGKPYKPGTQMCWVLTGLWGFEGKEYIGRSLRLYRDDKVRFGAEITGGLRISHMSHITESKTVIIPIARGKRGPWTVKPLVVSDVPIDHAFEILKRNARDHALGGTEKLESWWSGLPKESQIKIKPLLEEFKDIAKKI